MLTYNNDVIYVCVRSALASRCGRAIRLNHRPQYPQYLSLEESKGDEVECVRPRRVPRIAHQRLNTSCLCSARGSLPAVAASFVVTHGVFGRSRLVGSDAGD
jgi:hypothetical protein